MGTLKTDIFIARAECKWYTGEKTLPYNIGEMSKRRVKKILKSESENPVLNRKFMKNIDKVTIEPHEVELDKDKIKEGATLDDETHQVFEGELFFVIKVPSSLKIDPEELLENVNLLLSANSEYSFTKLKAIKYLGINTH
jgi:hypothetical protein